MQRTLMRNMLNDSHILVARVDTPSSEPVVMVQGMTPKRLRSLACWCLENADRQEEIFTGPYKRQGLRVFSPQTPEEVTA